MRLALLLAALAGCGGEGAPVVLGVAVQGYRGDREALVAELRRCEAEIEARSTVPGMIDGAWVRFVGEADAHCSRRAGEHVAGCWWMDLDLIVVERTEPLSDSALLHEFLHRSQFLIDGVVDLNHEDKRWWTTTATSALMQPCALGSTPR